MDGETTKEPRLETRLIEIDSDGLSDKDLETLTAPAVAGADGASTARPRTGRGFSFPDLGLDERLGRMLLALVLSALLWFYVVNLDNPLNTVPIKGLTIDERNPAAQLKVTKTVSQVDALVQGPQNVLGTLTQSDIRPYIDLTGLQEGVHTVPVLADLDPSKRDLTVTFSPPKVQVQLALQTTETFTVTAQVNGTAAIGYKDEDAEVDPQQVQVTGSKADIERVAQVIVEIDIDGKAGTQQGSKSPVAVNSSGQAIEGLTFIPPAVEIIAPIKLRLNYRVAPVRVPIIGQPASGYWVSSVTISPTNVTVCCSPNEVEDLQFIETQPVAITGTTSSVITATNLIMPPGLTLYIDQPSRINVAIRIEPISSTLRLTVAPSVEGIPPGYNAVVSPSQLDLTLAGTFEQLQGLSPTDVRAVINVEGRTAGTYSAVPQVTVPPGVRLVSVSPQQVTLTLIPPTPVPTETLPPIPISATETKEAATSPTPVSTRTPAPNTHTPQVAPTPPTATPASLPQPTRTPEPQPTPTVGP